MELCSSACEETRLERKFKNLIIIKIYKQKPKLWPWKWPNSDTRASEMNYQPKKNNNATTFKLFVTFFTEKTFSRGEFRSLLTFPDRVTWKTLEYRAVVLRSGSARALIRNSTEKNIKIVHIRFVFQFSLVSPSSRCRAMLFCNFDE